MKEKSLQERQDHPIVLPWKRPGSIWGPLPEWLLPVTAHNRKEPTKMRHLSPRYLYLKVCSDSRLPTEWKKSGLPYRETARRVTFKEQSISSFPETLEPPISRAAKSSAHRTSRRKGKATRHSTGNSISKLSSEATTVMTMVKLAMELEEVTGTKWLLMRSCKANLMIKGWKLESGPTPGSSSPKKKGPAL